MSMGMRRRLALAALAFSVLAWLVATLPFWFPRLLPIVGSNAVAAAYALGVLGFAFLGVGAGFLALAAPAARVGPRDAATVLLALVALAPALFLVLAAALLGGANLDH